MLMLNQNVTPDIEPLEFPDTSHDNLTTCPACDWVELNIESKAHKRCTFCDNILISHLKKHKKEHNYFKITPKINYFTRLIR